jgi:hypothetical protein
MKTLVIAIAIPLLVGGALAQKPQKPWVEWSKKDAEKILADSPWSQTQTEVDTSEMFYSPSSMGDTRARESQGATNQAASVKFYIRLFTARPVRQAYIRLLELNQGESGSAESEKRRAWANRPASDSIIVSVACDGSDRRFLGRSMQAFSSAVTAVLKSSVYLERKDGQRIFLQEYIPPGKDPFGARFIFPRMINGQPFITADDSSFRFHGEYENKSNDDPASSLPGQSGPNAGRNSSIGPQSAFKFKLDMKFKIADLLYNGELEY